MSNGAFNLSAIISLKDNMSAGVNGIQHSVESLNHNVQNLNKELAKLSNAFNGVNSNSQKSKKNMDDVSNSVDNVGKKATITQKVIGKLGEDFASLGKNLLLGGSIILAGKGLLSLANQAGEVQQKLIQLGGVYGLNINDSQLKDLEMRAQELSQKTLFDKKQVIGIEVELAHAGLTQEALKHVLPHATYLSEVEVGMGKSSSAERTAYNYARMAEDAGITRNEQRMSKFADDLYRVINVTHASSESVGETFKYAMPVVKNLGWNEHDTLLATAMAARAGVEGSMAGTHIKDFAERANPLKPLQSNNQKILSAMEDSGLIGNVQHNVSKNGKVTISGFGESALAKDKNSLKSYADMIDVLHEKHDAFIRKGSKTDHTAGMSKESIDAMKEQSKLQTGKDLSGGDLQWAALMNKVFGEQGQDFAIISSHKDMFERLKKQMDIQKNLEAQIKVIRGSWEGQKHVLMANLQTMGLQIGKPIMEWLIPIMGQVTNKLGDFIAYIDKAGGPLNALRNYIKETFPTFVELIRPLTDTWLPDLIQGFKNVGGIISNVGGFMKDNWGFFEPLISGIAISAAGFGLALGAISTASKIATAAQWLWNIALNANPIGLIVIGIGLLVGAGILLYQNWDTIRTYGLKMWADIKTAFETFWINMEIGFANIGLWASLGFKAILDAAKPVISLLPESVQKSFASMEKSVETNIQKAREQIQSLNNEKVVIQVQARIDNMINSGNSAVSLEGEKIAQRQYLHPHKNGLANVPYDNYPASLHKGERVLTEAENERYTRGVHSSGTKNINVVVNYHEANGSDSELQKFMKQFTYTLANV